MLQVNLSNKINLLPAYCHIHGTLLPQEVTPDSFHKTQRMRMTSSVTQDDVRDLVVNYLSFYSCQTMRKFVDENRVNVFSIYLYVA